MTLETQEQIDVTLSHCGELLDFDNGTILAIPGMLVYNIPSFDSPYDLEKQDFTFQISLKDFLELEIKKNDTFTYTLQDREYRFKVTIYIDDLIGWTELSCSLVEVVS